MTQYDTQRRIAVMAALERAPAAGRRRILRTLASGELHGIDHDWGWQAHGGQREPAGEWRTWLLIAGRGFGKTRAGAEWISARARAPAAGSAEAKHWTPPSIALVGATIDEVARVMIAGPSGLIATAGISEAPVWTASRNTLEFASGAIAHAYSAERPEGLRGGEFAWAWCDELAKWRHPERTWDNLQLSLRIGERPRAIVTTTPRPIALLDKIAGLKRTVVTRGRTCENLHVSDDWRATMEEVYRGTRTGRQELDGEMLTEAEMSLWPRELIERRRVAPEDARPTMVVIGVDPPASAGGDACGIVACGRDADGVCHVLGDHSVSGRRPEGWARAVNDAAERWHADLIVAERNNGGDMIEAVLRNAGCARRVRLVHASKGKTKRAEPVSALFEGGTAAFAGRFPALEDELAGLRADGGYEGPGRSPDRADALVWAMSEIMPKREAKPRIVTF